LNSAEMKCSGNLVGSWYGRYPKKLWAAVHEGKGRMEQQGTNTCSWYDGY